MYELPLEPWSPDCQPCRLRHFANQLLNLAYAGLEPYRYVTPSVSPGTFRMACGPQARKCSHRISGRVRSRSWNFVRRHQTRGDSTPPSRVLTSRSYGRCCSSLRRVRASRPARLCNPEKTLESAKRSGDIPRASAQPPAHISGKRTRQDRNWHQRHPILYHPKARLSFQISTSSLSPAPTQPQTTS